MEILIGMSIANLVLMLIVAERLRLLKAEKESLVLAVKLLGLYSLSEQEKYYNQIDRELPIEHFLTERVIDDLADV